MLDLRGAPIDGGPTGVRRLEQAPPSAKRRRHAPEAGLPPPCNRARAMPDLRVVPPVGRPIWVEPRAGTIRFMASRGPDERRPHGEEIALRPFNQSGAMRGLTHPKGRSTNSPPRPQTSRSYSPRSPHTRFPQLHHLVAKIIDVTPSCATLANELDDIFFARRFHLTHRAYLVCDIRSVILGPFPGSLDQWRAIRLRERVEPWVAPPPLPPIGRRRAKVSAAEALRLIGLTYHGSPTFPCGGEHPGALVDDTLCQLQGPSGGPLRRGLGAVSCGRLPGRSGPFAPASSCWRVPLRWPAPRACAPRAVGGRFP